MKGRVGEGTLCYQSMGNETTFATQGVFGCKEKDYFSTEKENDPFLFPANLGGYENATFLVIFQSKRYFFSNFSLQLNDWKRN